MDQDIVVSVNNQKIVGVLENQNCDRLIILIHGFTGTKEGPSDLYTKLSEELQANNYSVLRFNCRGTPPSDMEFANMTLQSETDDTQAMIDEARKLGYSNISLLGESMGGAIIANLQSHDFKSIIFWYPAFDFEDTAFKDLLTEEAQQQLQNDGYLIEYDHKVGKQFVDDIPKVKLYDKLNSINCPVLFMHGDADVDVPVAQSQKAHDICKEPKQLHIIKGADHCFRNEQQEAIDVTIDFLNQHLN